MAVNVEANANPEKSMSKSKNKSVCCGMQNMELDPAPAYIAWRQQMWDELKQVNKEWVDNQPPQSIQVTLPDGKSMEVLSWRTTPFEVAKNISRSLADKTIIAKVNGELWDLDRPFEKDSTLELLDFSNDEAKAVFWHSSAHVLGEAMERHYGGHLCYGPPIQDGFYYDIHLNDNTVSPADYVKLEAIAQKVIKEGQPFERLEMTKDDLKKMFQHNQFKQRILNERIDTPTTTVYRCGSLIDLCRGPHLKHTGLIRAFKIIKSSSSYWEGKADAEALQRVYGISFPDSKQMKEWEKFQEEAAKRDHRKIGMDQDLFMYHHYSPGSAFFTPKGYYIYQTLCNLMEVEYRKRGFSLVKSPNIFNCNLWKQSGHYQHYAENMFMTKCDDVEFGLKPMNCPGHCLLFDSKPRSWKEMPIRYAEFGVLHRNESSGALSGLTRVRRFEQDDAHIFCRHDQIKQEIESSLQFMKHVYSIFGFTFKLKLSTRPEGFMGDIETWNQAESQLIESLNEFGEKWEINPGDGAFYGPKIDITLLDALKRPFQCATIQLDFQMPEKFNLTYIGRDQDKKRPVIVHRAILGSVERMFAILCEHFAGKWPFWLSPRQVMVVPVASPFDEYATKVRDMLFAAGFEAEVDMDSGDTFNKKIRNAQIAKYNFILVVGEKELQNNTVNVRTRDNKQHGEHVVEHVIERMKHLKESMVNNSEEEF